MAIKFDTESRDRKFLAPPHGKCHVCIEGKSEVNPGKADAHSYELIGLFMDAASASRHAELAQVAYPDKIVVAWDFNGQEIYRGKLSAKAKAA